MTVPITAPPSIARVLDHLVGHLDEVAVAGDEITISCDARPADPVWTVQLSTDVQPDGTATFLGQAADVSLHAAYSAALAALRADQSAGGQR